MGNIELAKRLVAELTPEQRANLDQHLLGMIADDAESKRSRYEIELASSYMDEAKKLRDNWGKMQGLSTGYNRIDRLMLGLVGGEVSVIAGATSQGKTALAVNITARVVAQGIPVLFVTLEMTKAQLTSRLLYADPNFEDNASLVVYQKHNELDWQSIHGLIYNAAKQMDVKLVVIDHLHYFTRELEKLSEDLGRITKEFKRNAVDYDLPVLLISHIRKLQKGSKASIDDLRGSSYIAQDADVVLMVEQVDTGQLVVTCEKNRNRGVDFKNNIEFLEFDRTRISERV